MIKLTIMTQGNPGDTLLTSVAMVQFGTISRLNQTVYMTGLDRTNINWSKWSQSGCGPVMNDYEWSEP